MAAWYHQHITRRLLTAFMEFLNGIYIEKFAWDETAQDYVPRNIYLVPVHFNSGDKMWHINNSISARKTIPPEDSLAPVQMHLTVPRIGVSLSGIVYDTDRHNNKLNRIAINQGADTVYMPVPYNLELEVTSIAKSLDDSNQMLEQIIPYFTPAMSLDVNTFQDEIESIPITLNSISLDYPNEIQEVEDRLYQVNYYFTIRGNYYMQKKDRSIIEHVHANIKNFNADEVVTIDVS